MPVEGSRNREGGGVQGFVQRLAGGVAKLKTILMGEGFKAEWRSDSTRRGRKELEGSGGRVGGVGGGNYEIVCRLSRPGVEGSRNVHVQVDIVGSGQYNKR